MNKQNKIAPMMLSAAIALSMTPAAMAQSAQVQGQTKVDANVGAVGAEATPNASPQTASPAVPATPAVPASPEKPVASAHGVKSWNELDADGNGSLSVSEAAAMPSLEKVFAQADANADGELSGDEYRTWFAANGNASDNGADKPESKTKSKNKRGG